MEIHDFQGFLFTQIGMHNLEPGRYLREKLKKSLVYEKTSLILIFQPSSDIQVCEKILGSCQG